MKIARGFSDVERPEVAALYWEAFGAKLGRILGPDDKAIRLIARTLAPDHAFCARDGEGRLNGVVGFRTRTGGLLGGRLSDMIAVYGLPGALWRMLLLALLRRDVDNDRFLIDGIFVAREARGQGVGSRLLEAIANEARSRGYREIRLDVIDSNSRARALYERRGFVAQGGQSLGPLQFLLGFRESTIMVRRLS